LEEQIIGLIIGMAVLTFFTRFAFAVLFKGRNASKKWNALIIYVPIAVFTTIIVPALLFPEEKLDISINNEYLIAGLISLLFAYKTKNLVGTVIIGISVILLLRFAFGL
jgi:branched-subunit amino acid transport protein